ncbi:Glutamate synthase [NADPH] large chain (chloroplast) [Gracilaria domingensis]|uniref:glutamate synthase n=1 Tax=Gracilaria domingensis TaxID=172961 RepID=UPI001D0FA9FA|nr:glutamate synthase [Gracilaria domingensis]KAI0556369.1 Glutamate synthase [NADPH] large chain [Gracilaria domingensis]UAD85343.1 glutamate synthase [Gracilaria domingensis]
MQASKYYNYQLNNLYKYPFMFSERDACGVGFITRIEHAPSHNIVKQALNSLNCMEHRGGCSADRVSGDGAGIMTQIPWRMLSDYVTDQKISQIGVAMLFMPKDKMESIQNIVEWVIGLNGLDFLKWRIVPVDENVLGVQAKANQPLVMQFFVRSKNLFGDTLEKSLFIIRKKIEKLISQSHLNLNKQFYFCSFSSRIIVYKGMVQSQVLSQYYLDLCNINYESNFAMYHRRFSTNTMPKWPLAQPMRFMAHNGEINTLLGNLNWMQSKESLFQQSYVSEDFDSLRPITNFDNSDSANLDAVLELLIQSGKSPQESLMILIPEAYKNQPALENFPEIVDFYEYHNSLQEPWDGPALVVFSDGKIVGATLDRNGLRPARYLITNNGFISLSSEVGVLDKNLGEITHKGRLGPGQMICVDMVNNLILDNWTVKQSVANKFPYKKWLDTYQKYLRPENYIQDSMLDFSTMMRLHTAFGYTNEDVELVIEHMASSAKEPTFCMGDDIPLAILSEKPHLLYDFFKQRFAQVTNPAIDPLRESLVMSLTTYLGSKGNFLEPNDYMAKSIKLDSPILNEIEIKQLSQYGLAVSVISTFFIQDSDNINFINRITEICEKTVQSIYQGSEIIILSDRLDVIEERKAFLPPLLIVGAVHHYLISQNLRHKVSIIVETAQCWSTHHFACLIGYGASAICPYMAFLTVRQWWHNPRTQKLMSIDKLSKITLTEAQHNYRCAIETGLLKILSKMGISLLSSYHGAQIFEILGLGKDIVNLAFKGTTSSLDGITLKELAVSTVDSYKNIINLKKSKKLPNLGYVQYRPSAEYHVNNPEMSKTLHKAVRNQDINLYNRYKNLLQDRPPTNLRDLLDFVGGKNSIVIDEVESIDSIVKRFCTGGMSLGALSRETHETLAIAMNRLGGKSNSGEGGEDHNRFYPIVDIDSSGVSNNFSHLKGLKSNDIASSAIKQIASGRFGVTPEYLMSAKQLEIKIAQGAKPGEGGQLPGKKVSPYIAKLRNCKPGVTLISPPPHHDIYSIEDLAQLIFDLHQINPKAQVSVKLVAEIGIGTIAAGVAKANADIIQISGHDGGTGASPLSSIKHAGSPWELGLSEVHKTLVDNQLRDRVILRVDGGLRTGKDIVLAALMGAEEFGFGTIAMIATGCVMARICHTNNCPVGVATQREDLRKRYPGIPADLVNFFIYIAQEVRDILSDLGYSSLSEIIGHTELIQYKYRSLHKTDYLSLAPLLNSPAYNYNLSFHASTHENGNVLDDALLLDTSVLQAIEREEDIIKKVNIVNTDRTVGARISGFIAKKYGNNGFKGNLQLDFKGIAGQSFGAFILQGMHLSLIGEANDYVGKGMNGGEIIVVPEVTTPLDQMQPVIIGNTCLYGATGGYLFVSGQAGERFAVRNSLAQAVIEGVGDHACEYMTGGIVIVLGLAGRNIGAGMTGGLAYFLDENNDLVSKINSQIVKYQRIATHEGEKQLKNFIELYEIKTKSLKAQHILQNWSKFLPMFWQIFPPSEAHTALTDTSYSSYNAIINEIK